MAMHRKETLFPVLFKDQLLSFLGKKSDASYTYDINLIGSECNPLVEMPLTSMLLFKSGQH